VTMRQLAPTLHHDFQLIAQSAGGLARFQNIRARLLLLGGTASPAYLQASVQALAQAFPHARRVAFPGFNHSATGNTDQRGHPAQVAAALREFFRA
jgi:pimeloyl-ACP methyl ester carboxylesterase